MTSTQNQAPIATGIMAAFMLCTAFAVAQENAMRDHIIRWSADHSVLQRRYSVPTSSAQSRRMLEFLKQSSEALHGMDYQSLSNEARIDWHLLRNHLEAEQSHIEEEARRDLQIMPLLPFAVTLVPILEERAHVRHLKGRAEAESLTTIAHQVAKARKDLQERTVSMRVGVLVRARRRTGELLSGMNEWFRFHDGYNPEFGWWARKPYEHAKKSLESYRGDLNQLLASRGGDRNLLGEPIGEAALLTALRFEMIPYSPKELVDIAEREFAWCRKEMDKASKELGFDDWRAAQDHVKSLHVKPGHQPELIQALAEEAVTFLEERDLITIPSLAKEVWRMRMMSPARQLMSPYFLGGENIIVSYPTDAMEHEAKLKSLKGNNIHFCRATVQHELIPGHHLQGFMQARHCTWRRPFATPFWMEGWALYWELRLWDLGFPRGPEDRIGMLFWRKHRCARIVFSLNYHMERMSADDCVDYLIENVGHEPSNAAAEVRRSIAGGYGPLYQAAYMLGGLQIRALYNETVAAGTMTERQFHDGILKQNSIPIAVLREALKGTQLSKDWRPAWRF